ncbi:MAG: 2-C-methyl-D-erythritol 2,4-cyclodiphosphate synthase [Oscillospiraceae bacterium]|nr:2-C-methyl-D-erythritol 2,4-cyclodiphosphate synthase [Oscillospiraceae bacterium]
MLRIGHGYDVHRLVYGRKLILGGVTIPYEKGLLGHSDADVLCHAVTDSLLGALALGDLGVHFPPDNSEYKDICSLTMLRQVFGMVTDGGYALGNLDCTVICQEPKLAPRIEEMRKNIAAALNADISQISVKATTEEHLGFTGRGEGIAAHAVSVIMRVT